MTEAMPFLQKYDITFLTTPDHCARAFFFSVLWAVLLYRAAL